MISGNRRKTVFGENPHEHTDTCDKQPLAE